MDAPLTLNELFRLDRYRHQRGIVGLVDDLLTFCAERSVRITWSLGVVTASPNDGGVVESMQPDIRNSVYRACLARLSAICHEMDLDAGSPYGGTGEFTVDRLPGVRFRLDFMNTPDEQRLELVPVIVSELEVGTAHGERRGTIQTQHSPI